MNNMDDTSRPQSSSSTWRCLAPALALLLGALQALALAWPAALAWPGVLPSGHTQWYLQRLAMAGLYSLLQTASTRTAAIYAGLFAWGWIGLSVNWLYTSMHVYAGLAAPLAAGALAVLAAFLSSYFALGAALYKRWALRWRLGAGAQALVFSACWSMAELARHSWFTGFPWGASGYAHVDGPLAFLAPYVGVYGMAWLASLWACSIALVLQAAWQQGLAFNLAGMRQLAPRLLSLLGLCFVLWAAPLALHAWLPPAPPSHPPMQVDLLQGNISQGEKFEVSTGIPLALEWYKKHLIKSQAQLVITPETAIPLLPLELPEGYWLELQQHFAQAGKAALIGLPLGNEEDGYVNAVVGLKASPHTSHYAYFKHHLVPFGEFIPPLFRWFTDLLRIPLGDFSRGQPVQASFAWQGERFAPNICYEDLFGEELAARFNNPATAPTVLVNVSNLAWFGTGMVLDQHRHIARMRSLELDRPSLRATNTGATVLIDRYGRVIAELPRAQRGILRVQVAGNDGQTFFARWAGRYGQLPLWGWTFCLIAVVFLSHKYAREK